MENIKYAILGGGFAGVGAQHALGEKSHIFEKNSSIGGLCDSYKVGDFTFDTAVHASFTNDERVKRYLDKEAAYEGKPNMFSYYHGKWCKHPIQNNIFNLDADDKIKIVKDFILRPKNIQVDNYGLWLIDQYGEYFAKTFPFIYTQKYWGTSPYKLSTTWIGKRMYKPSIDEVLQGAFSSDTPNANYAEYLRYPVNGGFKQFILNIVNPECVSTKKEVCKIDTDSKVIYFTDLTQTHYDRLISSLPLPDVIKMVDGVPESVVNASRELKSTSMKLVSIGFKRKVCIPSVSFYVYDESIPFARAYSPSFFSPNNAPKGKSSLQFEIYFSEESPLILSDRELEKKVLASIKEMKIANEEDVEIINTKTVDYANVIYYLGMEKNVEIVRDYLTSIGITTIGRFGCWGYLWSDQAFISGLDVKISN